MLFREINETCLKYINIKKNREYILRKYIYADKLNQITLRILPLAFYDLQNRGAIHVMSNSEFLRKG